MPAETGATGNVAGKTCTGTEAPMHEQQFSVKANGNA